MYIPFTRSSAAGTERERAKRRKSQGLKGKKAKKPDTNPPECSLTDMDLDNNRHN